MAAAAAQPTRLAAVDLALRELLKDKPAIEQTRAANLAKWVPARAWSTVDEKEGAEVTGLPTVVIQLVNLFLVPRWFHNDGAFGPVSFGWHDRAWMVLPLTIHDDNLRLQATVQTPGVGRVDVERAWLGSYTVEVWPAGPHRPRQFYPYIQRAPPAAFGMESVPWTRPMPTLDADGTISDALQPFIEGLYALRYRAGDKRAMLDYKANEPAAPLAKRHKPEAEPE